MLKSALFNIMTSLLHLHECGLANVKKLAYSGWMFFSRKATGWKTRLVGSGEPARAGRSLLFGPHGSAIEAELMW